MLTPSWQGYRTIFRLAGDGGFLADSIGMPVPLMCPHLILANAPSNFQDETHHDKTPLYVGGGIYYNIQIKI